jgi:hypothetical protein
MAPPLVVAAGARLGVEVVGETIEGIFGLASATVTAAGEAAKGVGTAVGGALQGALSPAPVTVVNSVGMAGEAAKAKVTGSGAIPAAPKKSARPAANANMPTEKLLVIAVNYLSSIEKTLGAQLNFERSAATQQAAAEREAAIEGESSQATSPFRSLGEKLGAIKDNAADRAGTMAKILLGTSALAGLGLLGLGEMDTAELDRLKNNWAEFQKQWQWLIDLVKPVAEYAGWGTFLGYMLFGVRGAGAGWLFDFIKEVSGSNFAAGTASLTAATGMGLFGSAVKTAVLGTPLGLAATAALGNIALVDFTFGYTEKRAREGVDPYYNSYGLYPRYTGSPASVSSWSIRMPDRNINFTNISTQTMNSNSRESDPYHYWWRVIKRGVKPRWKVETDADQWLRTKGQAWLDSKYPKTANASRVGANDNQPDATPSRSGGITGAPVADAASLANLPPIPADIEKILATIRTRESGGNYGAQNPTSTASGAYQFIDDTWKSLTAKYGIGTEYSKAKFAPPEIQDAVAARYAQEILQQAGGDVSKVPVAWFTGNIRGQSDVVSQSEVANYQRAWMDTYTGGQYSGSSYDLQGSGASGLLQGAADLGAGAMEAIGTILRAALGSQTATTGSQLSGFNDNMQGNDAASDMASGSSGGGGGATPAPVEGNAQMTAALARTSTQIQNAVDLGNANAAASGIKQESAGAASIRQANASNDGKLECLDPNFPGSKAVEEFLQYHRLAA